MQRALHACNSDSRVSTLAPGHRARAQRRLLLLLDHPAQLLPPPGPVSAKAMAVSRDNVAAVSAADDGGPADDGPVKVDWQAMAALHAQQARFWRSAEEHARHLADEVALPSADAATSPVVGESPSSGGFVVAPAPPSRREMLALATVHQLEPLTDNSER